MLPFIGLERVGETVVTAPTKDAEADFAAIHHAPNHPRPPTTLNYSDFWPPELQGQDTKFDISTRPPRASPRWRTRITCPCTPYANPIPTVGVGPIQISLRSSLQAQVYIASNIQCRHLSPCAARCARPSEG